MRLGMSRSDVDARGGGQLWTEVHRARHEPRLKELVSGRAADEIAGWLGRADPPRSGRATPIRGVVGAITWHLRVGGSWRALPPGFPPWRTVYGWFRQLARPRPVRGSAAGRGAPSPSQGRPATRAELGHHRHAGGEVHR